MIVGEEKLVSIALCTYNGQQFLVEQLDSLINQDYTSLEIIIVDDNSSDETFSILNRFAEENSKIKLYRNEQNVGYIRNFERAISLCSGEHIALCDQDDIWEPQKISEQINALAANDILVYHDSLLIDENNSSLETMLSRELGIAQNGMHYALLLNNCMAGHTFLFKRQLLDYVLPIPNGIPHDHWIGYCALTIGKVSYINMPLVNYRKHEVSITKIAEGRILNTKSSKKKEEKKAQYRLLKETRLKNMKALYSFKGNTVRDKRFINRLITLYKKNGYFFSFKLFAFLILNLNQIYSIYYYKSTLSRIVMAFKESRGYRINSDVSFDDVKA